MVSNWKQLKCPSSGELILKIVLYSSRGQTTDAIKNIDEPQVHCIEWKKPDTKELILMIYLDEVQE